VSVDAFLAATDLAATSRRVYCQALEQLAHKLGPGRLEDIDAEHLEHAVTACGAVSPRRLGTAIWRS
jgi:hypothetical protein